MDQVQAAEKPIYKLLGQCYMDDCLLEPGTLIEFEGTPNEAMEPQNEPARQKLMAYLDSLDQGRIEAGRRSRELADIVFDEVSGRPRERKGVRAGHNVVLPAVRREAPPMGNMPKPGQRDFTPPPRTTKVVAEPKAAAPQKPVAISSMNPETYRENVT